MDFLLKHGYVTQENDAAKDVQYSGDLTHPEEVIEFPQGTVKKYRFDENATLYLWLPNDRHYNPQGILRYEVNNIKQSAEQIQELTRNAFQGKVISIRRGEYYVPRSIDEITEEIVNSKKSIKDFKSENADNVLLTYNYSDQPLKPAQEFILKQGGCGHAFRFATASLSSLTAAALIAGMSGTMSLSVQSPIPGILGMSFALLVGGLSLYHSIIPKKSTVQTISGLLPKIKKELKSLEKITAAYETAKDMNSSIKFSEQLSKQKEKLNQYWHAMDAALTQNCVSLTYTNESPEKIFDYFSQLRKKMKKAVQIPENPTELHKSKQIIEAKQNLLPVPTIDEIIIKQDWESDENYGKKIDGRYELKELIGEGGMSKVYKAITLLNGKEVAIKFEKPSTSSLRNKEDLIKTLCGLEHENLLSTTDANLDSKPAYVVMDLIDGADLGMVLDFVRKKSKESKKYLSLENIVSIAKDIGDALQFLHENGSKKKIIHNDIKPSNMMVDEQGKAYLGDCDIADMERDLNSMLSGMTAQRASGAGTLEYMAPERRGIIKAPISERSDVYSFGVVLYELAKNMIPMTPDGLDERTDMPQELKQFICKCVKINPDERYQTMKEALEELNKIPIQSKPLKLVIKRKQQITETPEKEPELPFHEQAEILQEKLGKQINQLGVYAQQANEQVENLRQQIYNKNTAAEEPKPEAVKVPELEYVQVPEQVIEPAKETAPEIIKEPEQQYVTPVAELAEPEPKQEDDEEEPEERLLE